MNSTEIIHEIHTLEQAAGDNKDWFDQLVNDCADLLECEQNPSAILGKIKFRNNERIKYEAHESERNTVHQWLNDCSIPREELGKPICLLRRLRIACDRIADSARHDSTEANATLIVRCVNNAGKLAEQLSLLIRTVNDTLRHPALPSQLEALEATVQDSNLALNDWRDAQ